MSDNQEPKIYPAWRQTLREIELADIKPGQVLDREWLENSFGIKPPTSIAQYQKNESLFQSYIWLLRQELLKKHRLHLEALPGVGYEVVPPHEQTARAMKHRSAVIKRELEKLAAEVTFVRTEELDAAGRKANLDAQAKVGALMGMTTKQLGFKND